MQWTWERLCTVQPSSSSKSWKNSYWRETLGTKCMWWSLHFSSLWIHVCMLVPKKVRPCNLVASVTSCQNPDLGFRNELVLTAWPCYPCKHFKALIYKLDIRREMRTHRKEKSYLCKQFNKDFGHDSYLQFQRDKKACFISFFHHSLEVSKLIPSSLSTNGEITALQLPFCNIWVLY